MRAIDSRRPTNTSIGGMAPSFEAFPDSLISLYNDTIAPSSSILYLTKKKYSLGSPIAIIINSHLSRRTSSSVVITAAKRRLFPEVGRFIREDCADALVLDSGGIRSGVNAKAWSLRELGEKEPPSKELERGGSTGAGATTPDENRSENLAVELDCCS